MSGRRARFVATWLVVAAVLGGGLLMAELAHRPLDDPDLAFQRPGLLDVGGPEASGTVPAVTEGVPSRGARAVVFFVRPEQLPALARALDRAPDLRSAARLAIVIAGARSDTGAVSGVSVVADPAGRLASAYGLRHPRDRGPPVGVAIVDRASRVRYRTLDPGLAGRLDEIRTILAAIP
jgi:hypothetical protein